MMSLICSVGIALLSLISDKWFVSSFIFFSVSFYYFYFSLSSFLILKLLYSTVTLFSFSSFSFSSYFFLIFYSLVVCSDAFNDKNGDFHLSMNDSQVRLSNYFILFYSLLLLYLLFSSFILSLFLFLFYLYHVHLLLAMY